MMKNCVWPALKNAKTQIYRALYPSRCIFCDKILPDSLSHDVCAQCAEKYGLIKKNGVVKGEFFDDAFSAYPYEGSVRQAMIKLKFKHRSYVAPVLAAKIAEQLELQKIPEFDIITWVPIFWRTKRTRGYDQAELIAKALAVKIQVPIVPLLVKTRKTRPMHKLKAAERRANVIGAFRATRESGELDNMKILLVDDTLTTGSTVSECARILKMCGASKVYCATAAKTQYSRGKATQ